MIMSIDPSSVREFDYTQRNGPYHIFMDFFKTFIDDKDCTIGMVLLPGAAVSRGSHVHAQC